MVSRVPSSAAIPVVFSFMHEPEFASNSNHFYEQLIDPFFFNWWCQSDILLMSSKPKYI